MGLLLTLEAPNEGFGTKFWNISNVPAKKIQNNRLPKYKMSASSVTDLQVQCGNLLGWQWRHLHTPPCWRYTTVKSVLRHKHACARKLLRELHSVRNACSVNKLGIRNVRFPHFHSSLCSHKLYLQHVGVLRQWRRWRHCASCIDRFPKRIQSYMKITDIDVEYILLLIVFKILWCCWMISDVVDRYLYLILKVKHEAVRQEHVWFTTTKPDFHFFRQMNY